MAQQTVERGSQGEDVKGLQVALTELDFKPGVPDGAFGIYTESAVRSFQAWATLTVDGVVGPLTWEKLDHADKDDPTVQSGSAQVAVRGVQRRLIELGFDPGDIDGHFGEASEAAVRKFQEKYELDVDGVVGPATWAVLNSPPAE